jgi:hypothetical protein
LRTEDRRRRTEIGKGGGRRAEDGNKKRGAIALPSLLHLFLRLLFRLFISVLRPRSSVLQSVSINSAPEEALRLVLAVLIAVVRGMFPLIPLPKKRCDKDVPAIALAEVFVSINSAPEEALRPNALVDVIQSVRFPLIPLPKKRCDYFDTTILDASELFPLIPLPKKRCDY